MIEGWSRRDWDRLVQLFNGIPDGPNGFRAGQAVFAYPGYKPAVREAPNGDTKVCPACRGECHCVDMGATMACLTHAGCPCHDNCKSCRGTGRVPNVDASKRYLHIADKYNPPAWARVYQDVAYAHAARVAEALKVPREFFPVPSAGALRILEYPVGAGSAEHCDFDLFTVLCWRETPEDLELTRNRFEPGHAEKMRAATELNPGLHIGELGELVGLGPATPHRVPARPYVQRSIVYFALPDHAAILPGTWIHDDGSRKPQTVGEWLDERMKRSRYT